MRIETTSCRSADAHLLGSRWLRRLGSATAILLYTALALALGAYLHRVVNLRELYASTRDLPRVVANASSGMLAMPEQMSIHIRFKHYEKLAFQRQRALDIGTLIIADDDEVPATVEFRGETIPVRIRLKGDDPRDHLTGQKWSFRVKTRGEHTLMGMKQFSIHRPEAREYIYEWVYHQALRREGVLALRYDFIRVSVNGKDLGIYGLEEHFEKRLIEYNRRREGPIVRFDEGPAWQELVQQSMEGGRVNGVGSYFVTGVDAFQSSQWLSDPHTREVHDRAVSLLAAFRDGTLTTSEVFDVDKLATYFAVSDLMGALHGTEWKNVRFYFNPITSCLEPIAFDGSGWSQSLGLSYMLRQHITTGKWTELVDQHFNDTIFRDPVFLRKYVQKLAQISQPGYVDRLLSEIDHGLRRNLATLYAEVPGFKYESEGMYKNQRYIRDLLHPTAQVIAYLQHSSSEALEVELGNPLALPVEVLELARGAQVFRPLDEAPVLPGKTEVSTIPFQAASFVATEKAGGAEQTSGSLRVRYRILGTDEIRDTVVNDWPYAETERMDADRLLAEPAAELVEFVVRDDARKQISIKPGQWTLSSDLVIPAGYTLTSDGGVTLNLTSFASILCLGPVRLIGTEEQPIVLESRDGTGRGLRVVDGEKQSTLSHVIFRGLGTSSNEQRARTTAATFDRSPVAFDHCAFLDNGTDQGLRLRESPFFLSNCAFMRTQATGLSSWLCDGKIQATTLSDCRGDGVHVVGGDLEIEEVSWKQVRGTGLVVGENSHCLVRESSIIESKTAVALKDASFFKVRGLTVRNCESGILTRREKQEFGSSAGDLSGVKMESVETPYLIQDESTVRLEGVELTPAQKRNPSGLLAESQDRGRDSKDTGTR